MSDNPHPDDIESEREHQVTEPAAGPASDPDAPSIDPPSPAPEPIPLEPEPEQPEPDPVTPEPDPVSPETPIEPPSYDDTNPNPPTEQFFGRSIN